MDRPRPQRRALLSPLRATLLLALASLAIGEVRSEDKPRPGTTEREVRPGQPGLRKLGKVRLNPEDIPAAARKKQLKRDASPLGRKKNANSAPMEAAYRALKNGRHYRAVLAIDDCNRAGQRDPRVQELAGAAWSALGHYDEAMRAFRVTSSGPYYEELALEGHADTLRAFGQGAEAAALRSTLRVDALDSQRELNLLLEMGDDYLTSGDGFGAEQVLLEAYAAFPRAAAVHYALADAYALQGDADSEGFHRWLAERATVAQSFRELAASARDDLDAGLLHRAEETILKLTNRRRQNVEVTVLRVELFIAQGAPEHAASLLDNSYWRERANPELHAARALTFDASGQPERAAQTLSDALALYPQHPALLRASAALR